MQAELYTLCSLSSNFTACPYALRDQRLPPQRQLREHSGLLCCCWEVTLYMLSDWTLYVALSRSCAYCMRCSKWKWELKRTLYFVLELQGPSWSHSSLKVHIYNTVDSSDIPLEAHLKKNFCLCGFHHCLGCACESFCLYC